MAKQTAGYKATIVKRKTYSGHGDYHGERIMIRDSIGREWFPWEGLDPYHGVIPVGYSGINGYRAGVFSIISGTDTGYIKIHKDGSKFGSVKVVNGAWVKIEKDKE